MKEFYKKYAIMMGFYALAVYIILFSVSIFSSANMSALSALVYILLSVICLFMLINYPIAFSMKQSRFNTICTILMGATSIMCGSVALYMAAQGRVDGLFGGVLFLFIANLLLFSLVLSTESHDILKFTRRYMPARHLVLAFFISLAVLAPPAIFNAYSLTKPESKPMTAEEIIAIIEGQSLHRPDAEPLTTAPEKESQNSFYGKDAGAPKEEEWGDYGAMIEVIYGYSEGFCDSLDVDFLKTRAEYIVNTLWRVPAGTVYLPPGINSDDQRLLWINAILELLEIPDWKNVNWDRYTNRQIIEVFKCIYRLKGNEFQYEALPE